MQFLRAISLCLLVVGVFSSCDRKKDRNVAPKPPPAPAPKPKVIKPRIADTDKVEIKDEPSVLEWEGGEFSVGNSFRESDLILVMFYADWCDHCKAMTPLLEGMTMNEDKKIRVLRVNADLFPDIAHKFGVVAVPKVLIFKKGEQVGEFVGAISEDKLDIIIRNVSGDAEETL